MYKEIIAVPIPRHRKPGPDGPWLAVHPLEETSMRPLYRLTLVLSFVVGLAGLTAPHGWTQEAKGDPIVERMKKDIVFLASDECEGRGVGTLGLDLAAQYIAVQLAPAVLKPDGVNGTYLQPFPFAIEARLDPRSMSTPFTTRSKPDDSKNCTLESHV